MNVKKEMTKNSQQSQRDEDFPYKMVFHRSKGIYIGRPVNGLQLLIKKR